MPETGEIINLTPHVRNYLEIPRNTMRVPFLRTREQQVQKVGNLLSPSQGCGSGPISSQIWARS